MTGILLDVAYGALLVATSPMWLYRMIRHGRYRQDIGQRFGAVPRRYGLQPTIWIHGVSLGEVNAARTLVAELHGQLPDYRVVVSSTTATGMAAARRIFQPGHMVFRWPLDFSLSVRMALRRIRPSLVVLMEGEVWPNFISACRRRDVPVVVVNARMSADKGYPGYKRLGPLARMLFNGVTAFGVQDASYVERFASLGVDPDKLHVTGMMKFDTAEVADRLDGQWIPLAAEKDVSFASMLNVEQPHARWTDVISHGELLRAGYDEKLQVDGDNLRLLFQGVLNRRRTGKNYGQIPWRLGILEPAGKDRADRR